MSVRVHHLTKVYGRQRAVDDISFEIAPNEIVGFLGPNGAGKSTTMKMATGYIPPTEGLVYVGGYDVTANPRDVKRITGYLPEHNPLYLDMYLQEYLRFAGGLYGLKGSTLKSRVGRIIELCGLAAEQNKKLENLSKGYRQRVGLAHALIHDPQVLILDEPTSGLDPNQLVEVRKLIREISRNKTVIFSTHIMQEVEALCDRVIVINRGKIVADDSLANLKNAISPAQTVIVQFESPVTAEDLRLIPGVTRVDTAGENIFRVISNDAKALRAEIFRWAADRNLSLVGLKLEENSLESIFRQLTGF